jgi:hypothetical protein
MSNRKNIKYTSETEEECTGTGFVDVESLQSAINGKEIARIDKAIYDINEMLSRYVDECMRMWNTVMSPFLESSDCGILHYLDNRYPESFIAFMKSQNTYRHLTISKSRLIKRRGFLTNPTN